MPENVLSAEKLTLVKNKRKILDIPSFILREGEILALIGPNGAGKSSLLQILSLLQEPTTGDVRFRGEIVHRGNALAFRRRMAVVFQEALLLNTTVFNNVAQGLQLRNVPRSEIPERVNHWLEKLGVAHLSRRMPRFLSGGEAQRVSLARALVLEPEVLFLDEPFSALDSPTRTALLRGIGKLLNDSGITTVFVTHDFSEVDYLTGQAALIKQGCVQHRGAWDKLKSDLAVTENNIFFSG
ncbi:ABC-type tungstate transport system [Desulfocucumis palustris]|uniref:ABC-type tungstate transport system n=1 Tax=Desulfocucumis palustris TaxID=1898651 RepID=A0A2L2XAA6_9FIRM|nr:ATP-binding cassette domain-containing protein [Desulfocucumis palustris]GBF32894.1 ABC-type tungstate transport system [Desulfocucumis palustris]